MEEEELTRTWIYGEVGRVAAIAASGDCEAAHSHEDRLWEAVLRAIADGRCRDPQACAREALQTLRFGFPRHCG